MNKEIILNNNWYQELLRDLRKIEFTSIVLGKLAYGNRILLDHKKFEQGEKRVENLSKDLRVSTGEIYRCIKFAEVVRDHPEFSQTLRKLQLSWNQVIKRYLYLPRPKPKPLPLPTGKYNIIYADPPWEYYAGGHKNQSQHYDPMTLEDICNLPITDLAADDCLLFMWVTFPMLDNFIDVLRCWGFEYSTVAFVWIKANKNSGGFFTGLGNWTRSNAEICVLGRRGKVERQDASISQIIYEPVGEHSVKPAITRNKIVQLVGDLPRIELFARQKTDGWDVWGDEI